MKKVMLNTSGLSIAAILMVFVVLMGMLVTTVLEMSAVM